MQVEINLCVVLRIIRWIHAIGSFLDRDLGKQVPAAQGRFASPFSHSPVSVDLRAWVDLATPYLLHGSESLSA